MKQKLMQHLKTDHLEILSSQTPEQAKEWKTMFSKVWEDTPTKE